MINAQPVYNPLDPDVHANPFPAYTSLRGQGDVVFNELLQAWMVVGYNAIREAFSDPRLSSQRVDALLGRVPQCPLKANDDAVANLRSWLLFQDPPKHTKLRDLVHLAFAPRLVQQLRPKVEALVEEFLKGEAEETDVISTLAGPLPVYVIADLLGLPRGDSTLLKRCSDEIAGLLAQPRPTPEDASQAGAALRELSAYFSELAQQRREDPQDDLITQLVQAKEQEEALSDQEIVSTCTVLLFGGHETTTNLIGNGMLALLNNPAQWARLQEDRSLIPNAVKELLRYDSPVQWITRVATEQVEIAGQAIPAGARVMLVLGSGNRDSRIFAQPDELDVTRAKLRPLSLGHGIHYCLGASLAQLEGEVAFSGLLDKFRQPILAQERLKWRPEMGLRGLEELWVREA